jgi:hypothetical protein
MDGSLDGDVVPQRTAQAIQGKRGVGSLVLLGLAIVLGLAVLFVVLGFTGGDLSSGRIRNKLGEWIPALASKDDGWKQVTDTDGGYTIDLPGEATHIQIPFAPVANGQMTGESAHIGTDTQLSVQYGRVIQVPGETAKGTLNRLGDAWVSGTGEVDKRTDTTYQGWPAIDFKIKNIQLFGKRASQRTLMFLKGDVVYVLQSQSIYGDNPSFPRMANSMHFTA